MHACIQIRAGLGLLEMEKGALRNSMLMMFRSEEADLINEMPRSGRPNLPFHLHTHALRTVSTILYNQKKKEHCQGLVGAEATANYYRVQCSASDTFRADFCTQGELTALMHSHAFQTPPSTLLKRHAVSQRHSTPHRIASFPSILERTDGRFTNRKLGEHKIVWSVRRDVPQLSI